MMDSFIIGQYVPRQSYLHQLDPRSKILSIFFFVIVIFLANNALTYTITGVFVVATIFLSKVPVSFIIKGIKPVLWVILFTVILHLLLTKEGDVVFHIGSFQIFEEGITQGVYISLRLLFIILLTTLLTLTTTPMEITDGFESLLRPFKRIGIPAHELALMMSISLRFIPTLMQETEKIMKAQSARGMDFTSGPLKERFKAIVPLLIPLFISSFKRAEELAMAMEARGYRGGEGRTKLRELHWRGNDTLTLCMIAILTALLFIFRAYG